MMWGDGFEPSAVRNRQISLTHKLSVIFPTLILFFQFFWILRGSTINAQRSPFIKLWKYSKNFSFLIGHVIGVIGRHCDELNVAHTVLFSFYDDWGFLKIEHRCKVYPCLNKLLSFLGGDVLFCARVKFQKIWCLQLQQVAFKQPKTCVCAA